MEVSLEKELSVVVRQSLAALNGLEAMFIEECHLQGKPLKSFAVEHGLSAQAMVRLRGRAFAQLKDRLSEQNINEMKDIV